MHNSFKQRNQQQQKLRRLLHLSNLQRRNYRNNDPLCSPSSTVRKTSNGKRRFSLPVWHKGTSAAKTSGNATATIDAKAIQKKRTQSMHASGTSGSKHYSYNQYEYEHMTTSCPNSPSIKKAYRLIILGSGRTGKTSILKRFLKNSFVDSYTPTIEDFHRKFYKIKGVFYQLEILDTSGNDPFPATRRLSLLTGDLFLIVCSLDNENSCDEAIRISDQIYELKTDTSTTSDKKHHPKVPMAIVLNKTDLPANKHKIDKQHLQRTATQSGACSYHECSAKDGKGIPEIFDQLFAAAKLPKELIASHLLTSSLLQDQTNVKQNGEAIMSPTSVKGNIGNGSVEAGIISDPAPSDSPTSRPHRQGSGFRIAAKGSLVRLRSKHSEPVIDLSLIEETQARRPSLRTDLLLLQTKNSNASMPCLRTERRRPKCSIM